MRSIRSIAVAGITAASVLLGTGVAHAVLAEDILLTTAEAQSASGWTGALTQQSMPATPGVLMRMWAAGDMGLDHFSVMVIDPQSTGPSKDDPKKSVDDQVAQTKKNFPNMECKVYEQSGTKITMVCWGMDPVMVMGFSSDIKTYYKKKKVKGKWKKVVWKQIPVMGTSQHIIVEGDTVTEAMKDQSAAEAKGLRNAQMAKMPAAYS